MTTTQKQATVKLSDQAIRDLCHLISERSFNAAFSVLQLVDDPQQRVIVSLAMGQLALTLTARLAEYARPEMKHEALVRAFADQIKDLAIKDQPPLDWLQKWLNK